MKCVNQIRQYSEDLRAKADEYSELLLSQQDESSVEENNKKIVAQDKAVEEYLKKVSDLEEAEKENISDVSKETPVAIVPATAPPSTCPIRSSMPHSQEPTEAKSRFFSFPDIKPENFSREQH